MPVDTPLNKKNYFIEWDVPYYLIQLPIYKLSCNKHPYRQI